MDPAATLIPIVSVLSIFIGLPVIIFGSLLGSRFLKLKERELAIRQQELDVERERITVLKLLEENDQRDKALEIAKKNRE